MKKDILKALAKEDDAEEITISLDLIVTMEEFRRCVEHGREKKWTFEAEKDWAGLVVECMADRTYQPSVDDSRVTVAPEALVK